MRACELSVPKKISNNLYLINYCVPSTKHLCIWSFFNIHVNSMGRACGSPVIAEGQIKGLALMQVTECGCKQTQRPCSRPALPATCLVAALRTLLGETTKPISSGHLMKMS